MAQQIDQTKDIRPGEELNLEVLKTYLTGQLADFTAINHISQFPGGYSNLTYLLDTNLGEMVLRRPPFGANIKSAHDMGREYRVLQALSGHYVRIPKAIHHCEDEAIIGAPFYLMERVKGVILREKDAKNPALTPAQMQLLSAAVVDNLAELHQTDLVASGLQDWGKPQGYVQRQVEGWIGRYERAATDEIEAMQTLGRWMIDKQPTDGATGLIHNDYKYDNLVLAPDKLEQILAVLDWEMATIGDTRMDLGTSLAYWSEAAEAKMMPLAANNLSWLPGNLNRMEVASRYAEKTGFDLSNLLFYYVYGTYKIAVIVQQIYSRYKKGHTKDPRFAQLIHAVHYFANQGLLALEKDRISDLYV